MFEIYLLLLRTGHCLITMSSMENMAKTDLVCVFTMWLEMDESGQEDNAEHWEIET